MKSSMNMSMSLENVMALMEGNPKFSSTLDSLQTSKHNLDIVERYENEFTNSGFESLKSIKSLLNKNNLDSSFLIFDEEDLRSEIVKKSDLFDKTKNEVEDMESKISLIREDRTISEIEKEDRIKKVNIDKFELHKKAGFADLAVNTLKAQLNAFKKVNLDGDYLTKMFNDNKIVIEEQLIGLDEVTRINIETELFRIGKYIETINEKKSLRTEIENKIKEQVESVGIEIDYSNRKEDKTEKVEEQVIAPVDAPVIEKEAEKSEVIETEKEVEEPIFESAIEEKIEEKVEDQQKPLTFTDKYMNFKSDVSKVKENVKYKVTKMRKAFLGGYVKSMILGAGITAIASISYTLPAVIIGAGIGAGFNLLRNKMIKNMNIKLENNAKEMSTDVETAYGLFDGFCKMKKAYKESQIKLKTKTEQLESNELGNEAELFEEKVTPVVNTEQVESLEVNNEEINPMNVTKDDFYKTLNQYIEQGKEIPQSIKNKMLNEPVEENLNSVDNLDYEVNARMGGR